MNPEPILRASNPGPGSVQRAHAEFRDWRRSRPVWGGLLLILAGLEILAIPLASLLVHSAIKVVIYLGIGGVFGVLIGGLLVACGLLAWFHPVQRIFYAITGVLLALASFVATNLGGFFLGMLLGVFGASLVFAWAPAAGQDNGRHRGRRARPERGGLDDVLRPDGGGRSGRGRLFALPVVPLLLAGTLAMSQAPAAAGQSPPDGGCFIPLLSFLFCPSSSSSSSSASPSATPAAGTPAASATPTPSASADPSPSASPPATPASSPAKPVNPNAGKKATAAPWLTAASSPATITAGSALMAGLSYDGVATVPTAGGSQQMLKFSMSSLTLSGGTVLTVTEGTHTSVTRSSSLSFSGNVVLYATRMCGKLLGIPLCFTPQSPPPLVLPVMSFTDVSTDQPLTAADSLSAPGLDIAG